ncbi:MAG TPA: hypothetical protein VIN60_02750, partial [Anaerolineales bacterium]
GGLVFLKKVFRFQEEINISVPLIAIIGMAALATFTSYLSLVIPLGGIAVIVISLGGITIAFLTRLWKNIHFPTYHPLVWILLIVVFLIVLENSTHRPTNYDTTLYHAQTIHWIESYRVVPGLVNIHDRLAFDSSWLVLVASLSFAFLELHSFHLTNSVLLLTTMIYFADSFQGLIQKQITISNLFKGILFFLPLYLYSSDISSPGTDLPPILLTWVITSLILEKVEKRSLDFDIYSISIFILSIFAFTIKLSTLPLCGLALLVILQQILNKNWQRSAIIMATALFVLLPWFLRNIILSGYLIFPLPQIDLFSFDWRYPLSATIADQTGTLWFNRFPIDTQKYVGMTMFQWVPLWFHQLTGGEKILVLTALVSPVALPLHFFLNKVQKLSTGFLIAFFVNYIGLFFWLFTAPIIRFGYAYLLSSIILVSLPFISRFTISSISKPAMVATSLIILAVLFQFYFLTTTVNLSTLPQRAFLPADYYSSQVWSCPIGNAAFYCAQKLGLCSYEAFPCISKPRNNVEMRGASLQDGFRTVQNP